ncbi:MAG TPA: sulfotransferase [Candidatus Binatia bacterium]
MHERYARPALVRRLNVMAAACGDASAVVPIDGDELVALAVSGTGISDFGDFGDGNWRDRLRCLVAAINESDLTVVGRLMTRQELLRCLRTRLFMAESWRRDPGIAGEVVRAPLVVTGPARSGTTITFELLSLDPQLRSPRAADVLHPAPPPGITDAERLAMTECEQELWSDVQPEFAAIHELRSDLPVECVTINAPSFAGSHWPMILRQLGDWSPDVVADFAWHRALLKTLQRGDARRRWLLKTPGYLLMLDSLAEAYPDAELILTHRDPVRTMPSTVSTTAMVQWLRSDHVDLALLSPMIGMVFSAALLDVARRRRDGSLPLSSGDVRFTELLADPVAAIRAAYSQLGREVSDEHARAMRGYVAAKPQGKFGRHDYTAADWGFDATLLRRELEAYTTTFAVAVEEERHG